MNAEIVPHGPGIAGLQQVGSRADFLHPGIEPQGVAVWIQGDWLAVVDG